MEIPSKCYELTIEKIYIRAQEYKHTIIIYRDISYGIEVPHSTAATPSTVESGFYFYIFCWH